MIKKVLLFAVAILGAVSCSKSDDNNSNNSGDSNNALIGTWAGSFDIIAEKSENQNRIVELVKNAYKLIEAQVGKSEYGKMRLVFDKDVVNFIDTSGKVQMLQEMKYSIKGNQIINNATGQPTATYTLNGNNLTIEMLDYGISIIDAENIQKTLHSEIERLNLSATDPSFSQKITELTEKIQKQYTLMYKYKWNLTRQ
ncbi:MAG: hypothetical protein Q3983_07570 [Capnocytophaga sp.]|nr:hypothetical protein [Capnocytophaga sp.]